MEAPASVRELLPLIEVEKVVPAKDRSFVKIYIRCPRLIPKKEIYQLEAAVKKQFFANKLLTIKIIERFSLSSQYTPEKLMLVYRDSILLELKHYSMLVYSLFQKAEIQFADEGVMLLTVSNTLVARERAEDLKRILTKIFVERCGLDVEVRFAYKEQKERLHEKETEQLIKREAAQIAAGLLGEKTDSDVEADVPWDVEKPPSTKKPEKKERERGEGKGVQAERTLRNRDFPRKGSFSRAKKSDNPDVLFGRDFDNEIISIHQIESEMGEVAVSGQIFMVDERQLKSGNYMLIFNITDFTDSITGKMFVKEENIEEMRGIIRQGSYLSVKGVTTVDRFDGELNIQSITGIKKSGPTGEKRVDTSLEKRVELHCHTKMSEMDGVSDVSDLMKQARSWGHKALAITDHGCVQSFTEGFHLMQKWDGDCRDAYKKEHPDAEKGELKKVKEPFKLIYGLEGYLVDDLKEIVLRPGEKDFSGTFVVFDLETTGLSASCNEIIEIGAVKVQDGQITDRFSTFVCPEMPIPFRVEELTGINDNMVAGAPKVEKILPEFLKFCEGAVMVAHNASFDMSFVVHNAGKLGISFEPTVIDTVGLARMLLPALHKYKLDVVAKALHVSLENHHRAVDDAEATAHIFLALAERCKEQGITALEQINEAGKATPDMIKKMPTYHVILLAKNETGRVNLYRMVSESHITYFARRPRIPKSLLKECREGIIVGSACEAGELFQAIVGGAEEEEIARIVKFYDYLEIQPIGNNAFMLRDEKYGAQTEEDLQDLNRRVVQLGEQFGKPVVATCDVHFLNPEDSIYRAIIMKGKGFADAEDQAPLYLRTTEEMLKEFDYLGTEKAREVVITNTNLIADSIEKIEPVRPDKCPPVIPDSDKTLREICYNKAHEMYGDPLPSVVSERLERELNSIISNGFAVMYIIAQKLVWKSNADGYLVGSRGSVGSSFVATMAGITEVNPLSPHYYCPSCHFSDFDSSQVKEFSGMAGCDMPDRVCPVCGKPLKKDGFDIPFETFLGFNGDKEPDIDLNFSGEYQSRAHDYTEVIFGKGHTFRAGTIGTLAEKTAYGYVKKFVEETGRPRMRRCEMERLALGCTGVKRTTGQHPGGIVVMPHGENIYSFTPIQRPANDMTTKTVTTHFDYHSIDHNLLKLDILGHDDPTMIRMLEDLTGINAREIPLDNKEVMSLFKDTSALGISPEDIGGTTLGALGIPEFGTDFAMQMLIDTKPKYFSDLVRIAGLAHGTDVWLGNAQTLILEGTATIQEAICCRDDIMVYLIQKGMDPSEAFTIMENVRKGKFTKDKKKMESWIEDMKACDVPDWYIGSCQKIKYMFPKAHAAAYVMMAWRIAYCKIFYPLAYYAAFFSIRASGFSYELMCQGRDVLERNLSNYKRNQDQLTQKEQDSLRDMRIVQEMYARGFEFVPIDLYKANATRFQIVDGKIMPSLSSIDGMGEKAAEAVVEAAQDGPFLSKEDFRQRTKVSLTVIDLMSDMGLFGDLPNSNQISLFDLM